MHLTKPGRNQSIVAQPTKESDFGTDLLTKAKESSDDDGAGLCSYSKDNDRIRVTRKPTSRHHQKSPATRVSVRYPSPNARGRPSAADEPMV